jgi:peptidyl-prolyl cis-trans isomerase C
MNKQRKNAMISGVAAMVLGLTCGAQVVASHAPTLAAAPAPVVAPAAATENTTHAVPANLAVLAPAKPVVRVNDAVLTDRDLAREIQMIFPYEKTHDGVPKAIEPEMRKGAMQMMVFEELVYQEALRRKLTVAPERLKKAEAQFRRQFQSDEEFQKVMEIEVHGSAQLMRDKIRRSLLIEELLKSDVTDKAAVSEAQARAYYVANPKKFQHGELFSIQTISIIPPGNSSAEVQKEASQHAQDAWKQAKATKSYKEFGLLAEKVSDDDWHVNMGDRKVVEAEKLPPPVVEAARAMKAGQVSELIQLGNAYTMFRLNEHTPAGTRPFAEVKVQLMTDLQKQKNERLRADLNRRLRKTAKIEEL